MRGLGAVVGLVAVLGFPGAVGAASESAEPDYRARELLVRFEPGTTASQRADVLADLDATVVERLPLADTVRVRLAAGTSVQAADSAFERRGAVDYAQPNYVYRIAQSSNDPQLSNLWGLTRIDAPGAWDLTQGSDGVIVGVVDTGVDYNHTDLAANIWQNDDPVNGVDDDGNGKVDDLRGWDFFGNDNNPSDAHGHGTHVAGTVGAVGNNGTGVTGVNWRVKLMPLKASDDDPTDPMLQSSWIIGAFRYACDNGAKIVNGSFGGNVSDQAMLDAINACPGTLFVFAAGNDSSNNDEAPAYPCNYGAPNIVCVGASTQADGLAGFSNFGLNAVDVAAPGDDILSTLPGGSYGYADGTSMAAPHVAGSAALVLAHSPMLTTDQLRRSLLASADAKPALAGLLATGARLNVRRALSQELVPPTGLTASSTSPSYNAWSNVSSATVTWGGATDPSGIDGYSFGWSADANFVPDEVKDVEENVTSTSANLPDGRQWFHVRVRDGVGNWSGTVHLGPFMVDSFPPVRPTLSSPSHRAGVASANRTVQVTWVSLGDSISGVDGYSFAWSRQSNPSVDAAKDVEETVSRTTSPKLAAGAWWFGIRARDNAGNWTDTTVLGPFVLKGSAPGCTVPRLRGLTLAAAKRSLVKRGCALGRVTRAYSSRVRSGRVVSQRRVPGLRLRRGTKIAVVVSRGRKR